MTVADVQFNDQLLMKPRGQSLDISGFERGNPIPAGEYPVDVYVNGDWLSKSTVTFVKQADHDGAVPCFDRSLLQRVGLNFEALPENMRSQIGSLGASDCVDLNSISKDASWQFDMGDLRFDVSLPQAIVLRNPRGYVSPELWDEGVPSATLAYNGSVYRYTGPGYSSTQSFLGLTAGVNLGSWHLRQQSSIAQGTGRGTQYQNIATYLQHDIPKLKSQLILGDSYTDGAVFDSIGIEGVQLVTDDRMLPDSMRGYAPVIRGVATTNARVTVTQNGNRLYETVVAPGPFEIKDLNATGYGGNLLVTVTEADGSQHSYTVPYASVTQLLRPGTTRYNVVAGAIRDGAISSHKAIVQGTVQYGVNNLVTAYGGTILADGYLAALGGAALNTPIGAFSADFTEAQADIPRTQNPTGQSFRVGYSKFIPDTNTSVAVAAYRYSSSGFWSLRDAMVARDFVANGQDANNVDRQRNQFQVTLNQSLGEKGGNMYVVGSTSDYWNRHGTMTQFQVGYNNSFRLAGTNVSYNLSVSRQSNGVYGGESNQVYASVSLPLGKSQHAPTLATGFTHDSVQGWSEQAMLTGTAGADNEVSYGLFGSNGNGYTTGGGNAQYRSPYATFSGSASGGSGTSQVSAGIQGAVVAHPGGVTLANYMGDTVGVVEAKDAAGARVLNSPGVRIDSRGYAVVPYLTPYSLNTVDIDPKGIPLDVEFKATSQQVAPRANSVVMLKFPTSSGRSAIISTRLPNGAQLPFGATVTDEKGIAVGAIGQNSQLFVRGVADEGTLVAKWGGDADQTCQISYRLPPKSEDRGAYAHVTGMCGDVVVAGTGKASRQSGAQKPTDDGKADVSANGLQPQMQPAAPAADANAQPVAAVQQIMPGTSASTAPASVAPVTNVTTYRPVVSNVSSKPLAISGDVTKRTSIWDDWQSPSTISTGDSKPAGNANAVMTTGQVSSPVEDAVASNVATANQYDGAARLMLMTDAAPMTMRARVTGLSVASSDAYTAH